MIKLFAIALLGAMLGLATNPGGVLANDKEPTLLTITGKITKTNRAAFSEFDDAFLKSKEESFTKAFAFTRSALEQLPQQNVQARVKSWPKDVRATGPRLSDVLKAVGVTTSTKISLVALDGYTVELEAQDLTSTDWVLAITADGKPLGVGGRGPAWLLHDTTTSGPATEADEAKWVWSVFLIKVE